MEQLFDTDKLTDIEVAMKLLRLMDAHNDLRKSNKSQILSHVMRTYASAVKNTVETLSNPFAKKLLMDKLAEQSF